MVNELVRFLSKFGGSLIINHCRTFGLDGLSDIAVHHTSRFLARMDSAVVLDHAVVLKMHIVPSSLIDDPLVGPICPKDI